MTGGPVYSEEWRVNGEVGGMGPQRDDDDG